MELQKATIAMLSEAMMDNDKTLVQIANMLHTMANARLNQVNEEDKGRFKPDYIAYAKTRSTRHDITIAEVKPTHSRSGKPPSDLVKLGQQMKVMLNNLISHKVTDPIVCDILVKGKTCSLYKMDIIAPHFYRMMTNLKDITVNTARQIEKSELAKAKGKRKFEEVVPASWIHSGTCTFSKVKKTGD
ncbi:unnamed protein product [Rhizopus stolonifer]